MISQIRLSVRCANGVSNPDVSIGEDVGAKSATVDQPAQHTLRGEALQVGAGLTQPLSKTLDLTNSEPPTDQAAQIDTSSDQVAPSLFVPKSTTIRQHESIENLGLDKRQIVASPATAYGCKGPGLCCISITDQAPPGSCLCLLNEYHRFCRPSGERYRFHPAKLRW